jgi:hypothetical protein
MSEKHWCHKYRYHVKYTDVMSETISAFHMISIFMTSVFFRHLHLWHQCFRHDISVFHMISIFMTSVFFRHLHSWHQCVRHDIYIDNIIIVIFKKKNTSVYNFNVCCQGETRRRLVVQYHLCFERKRGEHSTTNRVLKIYW